MDSQNVLHMMRRSWGSECHTATADDCQWAAGDVWSLNFERFFGQTQIRFVLKRVMSPGRAKFLLACRPYHTASHRSEHAGWTGGAVKASFRKTGSRPLCKLLQLITHRSLNQPGAVTGTALNSEQEICLQADFQTNQLILCGVLLPFQMLSKWWPSTFDAPLNPPSSVWSHPVYSEQSQPNEVKIMGSRFAPHQGRFTTTRPTWRTIRGLQSKNSSFHLTIFVSTFHKWFLKTHERERMVKFVWKPTLTYPGVFTYLCKQRKR